ncbi:hypothetical protein EDC04DRAFT_2610760 [Pisolithus marmoratus]|nr:hypothetical protein EDC04DRAFT_2610760 [Pisolithus marmoratus]
MTMQEKSSGVLWGHTGAYYIGLILLQNSNPVGLLLTSALPEIFAFYQLARDGASPTDASRLKPLLPWIPKLLWALSLEHDLIDNLPQKTATHSVLYDEDTLPDKEEGMIRTAASTTIVNMGIRLTGFQLAQVSDDNVEGDEEEKLGVVDNTISIADAHSDFICIYLVNFPSTGTDPPEMGIDTLKERRSANKMRCTFDRHRSGANVISLGTGVCIHTRHRCVYAESEPQSDASKVVWIRVLKSSLVGNWGR